VKGLVWKRVILVKDDPKPCVWKAVMKTEPKFEQDDIEDAFEQKKRVVAGGGDAAADTKPKGPQVKEFFDAGDSRNIQLSMPKIPKYDKLIDAIINYNRTAINSG
jgi:hypothetical protein